MQHKFPHESLTFEYGSMKLFFLVEQSQPRPWFLLDLATKNRMAKMVKTRSVANYFYEFRIR